MKKIKILIISVLVVVTIIFTYKSLKDDRLNYTVLGDYLSVGLNAYNDINYGYDSYIKEELNNQKLLKNYNNMYTNSNYLVKDLISDVYNNKIIIIKNKNYYLKPLLNNSDLITISIGNRELYNIIKDSSNRYKDIDNLLNQINNLLSQIRNYNKKKIIFLGFYNYNSNSNKYVVYANNKLKQILIDNNIIYFDTYKILKSNIDYLPNPNSINPGNKGYMALGKSLQKQI